MPFKKNKKSVVRNKKNDKLEDDFSKEIEATGNEHLKIDHERGLLMSLGKSISAVRNKEDLLKIIFTEVNAIIPFDNMLSILVVDEKLEYYSLYYNNINEYTGENETMAGWRQHKTLVKSDPLVKQYFYHERSQVSKLKIWKNKFPDHRDVKLASAFNLQETLHLQLHSRGKLIGLLSLYAYNEGHFLNTTLEVIKEVADLLANALANILVYEELLNRQYDKELLLEISNALSKIKKRNELFQFIIDRVRPIFGFNDYTNICVLSSDQTKLNFFFTRMSDEQQLDNVTISHLMQGFKAEGILQKVLDSHEVIILHEDWKTAKKNNKFDEQSAQIWRDLDFKSNLNYRLETLGKTIGTFHAHFFERKNFSLEELELFKSIVNLIATAVSNILSNEEILSREKEKELLLNLSTDIAKINERQDLLNVITTRIKPIFNFDDNVVFVIDKSRKYYKQWYSNLTVPYEEGTESFEGSGIPMENNPVADDVFKRPVHIVSRAQMLEKAKGNASLLKWIYQSGTEEVLICPLEVGGIVIGCFNSHSRKINCFKPEKIPLYKNVCDQIAVAVANIIANEEILEREKEKSLLLEISEALSSIRDTKELFEVIFLKLQPLFHFDHAVITKFDPTKKFQTVLKNHLDLSIEQKAGTFDYLITYSFPFDSFFEKILKVNEVVYFNVKDESNNNPELHYLKKMAEAGIEETMCTSLVANGSTIGGIYLHANKKEQLRIETQNLFRNVANQIAVAVANILANEAIKASEQEKAFQVSIINQFNQNNNWEDKFLNFAKALLEKVPFHFLYITHLKTQHDYGYGYFAISKNEIEYVNRDSFLKMSRILPERYENEKQHFNFTTGKNAIEKDELKKFIDKQYIIHTIKENMNMKSQFSFPFSNEKGVLLVLSFFHKQENFYQKTHQEFLEKSLPTIIEALYKNLHLDEIIALKALLEKENKQLGLANAYLQEEINAKYNFEQIVGTSDAIRNVFEKVKMVAPTDSTVLLEGETGTGKELFARAIHNLSRRKDKPFIKVNCAALPSTLVESELFGHEKGSFTGAFEKRLGKFELANGGTLFLDEIGDMAFDIQPKLLRVLQEQEVDRIGSKAPIKIDVRIIAATNKNLEDECAKKMFRADLFYRLNTFPITLPPLRERREDIPLLADYYTNIYSKKIGKTIKTISSNAMKEMMAYPWPGNVRELEHTIENSVILNNGYLLELGRHLKVSGNTFTNMQDLYLKTIYENEKEHISKILKITKGRIRGIGGAAEILNINPNTLEL